MDRLQRLRLRTQEPRPKTATATATAPAPAPAPTMARTRLRPRDGVQRPQPTGKTRRKHRIARGQKVVCGQNALCSKQMVIRCRTQEDYTCQLSLLILLHTRSYATLCPIRQNDSERTIEYDYRTVPKTRYCFILLEDLGQELNNEHTIAAQLPYLEALEESLIGALHVLHSHNISFPVSTKGVKLVQQRGFAWGDLSVARLFLPYNENASWASGKLAPTWKADQLASARSIFFIPKLLARLAVSSKPTLLDLASQQALATYLKDHAKYGLAKYCVGITPVTAELAQAIARSLVYSKALKKSREFLESYFGNMPLPEAGTSSEIVCKRFADLRARAIESKERQCSSTRVSQDLELNLLVGSPELIARFVWWRAKTAEYHGDPDWAQWKLIAEDAVSAFPS